MADPTPEAAPNPVIEERQRILTALGTLPQPSPPGSGGWVPTVAQKWALTVLVTILGAVGPALLVRPLDVQALVAAGLSGLTLGLGTLLGISSAGPRTPGAP